MGKRPANKMPMSQRAKQFLPFDSLRGYYDLVREREKIKTEKKLLSQEEKDKISYKLSSIKKHDMVSIKYYNVDGYDVIEGMVSEIDIVYKTITVIKTKIRFLDIYEIELVKN